MFDPAHLVFLDETAANTKMMRVGGRCLRGERLIGQVPHGHWKTITFVGALRCKGMTAPYVIDGAMKCKIWYSISQTVSDLGNTHDRSIRAFAVKPRAFGAPLSGFGA